MGLFGLTIYTTEKRTKEIGIRKVMGARIRDVILMINKKIIILLIISAIPAWIISYMIMKNWLENFPYRIGIEIWVFLAATLIAFFIALATVSLQVYRAASSNPADSLRYE